MKCHRVWTLVHGAYTQDAKCGYELHSCSGSLSSLLSCRPFQLPSFLCVVHKMSCFKRSFLATQASVEVDFFTEYGEGSRYRIEEVIGKGSYGVVCSAYDTHCGEKVAIKKINDIFEHVSDATRILREIKLLRLLRHPDIVEIKHILLPPSSREFKDIYVVFELMESDLHQVIKANDDLTPEHYQFFLYQLLRGLKYIHTGYMMLQYCILTFWPWFSILYYNLISLCRWHE